MREQIGAVGAVIAGVTAYFLGGFDVLISVFAAVVVLDTLAGMLKGWNNGDYESKKFREGLVKKFGYIIGVLLVVQLDMMIGKVTGATTIFRDATITFFTVNEALSIIENLGEMGVNFPSGFQNAIKSLRDKTDNEDKQ